MKLYNIKIYILLLYIINCLWHTLRVFILQVTLAQIFQRDLLIFLLKETFLILFVLKTTFLRLIYSIVNDIISRNITIYVNMLPLTKQYKVNRK